LLPAKEEYVTRALAEENDRLERLDGRTTKLQDISVVVEQTLGKSEAGRSTDLLLSQNPASRYKCRTYAGQFHKAPSPIHAP
jgi:hypothetical protein